MTPLSPLNTLALAAVLLASTGTLAAWPEKPIRIVVTRVARPA